MGARGKDQSAKQRHTHQQLDSRNSSNINDRYNNMTRKTHIPGSAACWSARRRSRGAGDAPLAVNAVNPRVDGRRNARLDLVLSDRPVSSISIGILPRALFHGSPQAVAGAAAGVAAGTAALTSDVACGGRMTLVQLVVAPPLPKMRRLTSYIRILLLCFVLEKYSWR